MSSSLLKLALVACSAHRVWCTGESKRVPPAGQTLADVAAVRIDGVGAAQAAFVQTQAAGAVAGASAGADCSSFAGVYTGYEASGPIYDAYQLSWRGGEFPVGAFSAMYISPSSWALGLGQLSADNTTATISLDGGRVVLNGTVDCATGTLAWDNNSRWLKTTALPKRVHMIAMNHLDVGYDGIPQLGLINNILNRYFSLYFPRAVVLAAALRARPGGTERFVYTTHAWLVDLYLNCDVNLTLSGIPLACPTPADAAAFRAAIAAGDIVFHAAPFNIEYGGVLNNAMLDAIFAQPQRLAAQLGVQPSVVASLRDVPGAPRSLIPALARAGVRVLTVGVNNYAPRPQLPTPCVWREPATGDSVVLLMTEQGQGYPDNVGPSPTQPGGLGAPYCVSHPASAATLCFAFRTDNSGPPESVAEVLSQYDIARWQFPGAQVIASTLDAWWAEFSASPAVGLLPVVDQEMGETWITGYASSPVKMGFYRTAARAYAACVASGGCDSTDPRINGFTRYLMKLPEHTWGLPSIYDNANFSNTAFHAARAAGMSTYVNSEASWAEQIELGTTYAMGALGDHPLRAQIEAALAQLTPVLPAPAASGYVPVPVPGSAAFTVALPGGGAVSLALDAASGALASLAIRGVAYGDAGHLLGRLVYQTVNDTDTDAQHLTLDGGLGCCCCYGWPGMQKSANPASSRTPAALQAAWASQAGLSLTAPASILAQVAWPPALHMDYGAPAVAWLNYTINAEGTVSLEVQLFNKTATRLGEAIYLEFATPPAPGSAWFAEVLGHLVDPLDVVVRGSQRQHGVGESVLYVDAATGAGLAVDTLDAVVMSPWTAVNETSTMIVPFDPLVGPVEGFASVLFSNIYVTNFPLYSTEDAWKLRYVLRPLAASGERARAARAASVARHGVGA